MVVWHKIKAALNLELIFLLILPFIMLPIIASMSTAIDWLFSDGEIVLRILYASNRLQFYEYLSDWRNSFSLSIIVIWVLYTPLYLFLKYKRYSGTIIVFLSGLILFSIIGLFLYQDNLIGIIVFALSGLIISGFSVAIRKDKYR